MGKTINQFDVFTGESLDPYLNGSVLRPDPAALNGLLERMPRSVGRLPDGFAMIVSLEDYKTVPHRATLAPLAETRQDGERVREPSITQKNPNVPLGPHTLNVKIEWPQESEVLTEEQLLSGVARALMLRAREKRLKGVTGGGMAIVAAMASTVSFTEMSPIVDGVLFGVALAAGGVAGIAQTRREKPPVKLALPDLRNLDSPIKIVSPPIGPTR